MRIGKLNARSMKYVTIKDIANSLGISKSTVSRALSGDVKNVSQDTREKILNAARKMGYKRNELAVNLCMKSTRTIGIIVPEAVTPFYMSFVSFAQNLLRQKGYRVILSLSNEDYETERMNLKMFADYRVEGILISACHNKANLDIYRDFVERSIPMVFFDRTISEVSFPKVKIDDYIDSFFMVEHLIRNKRKNIIHLAGPSYIQNSLDRKRGYRDALEKFHIAYNPSFVIEAGVDAEDGAAAVERLFRQHVDFDAIFCFTEMQALGAKRFLQEHDIAIPQKVAISCMSGTRLSTLVHPALTAVEQPVERMAMEAVRLVIDKIKNYSLPDEIVTLPSEMIIRKSTEF